MAHILLNIMNSSLEYTRNCVKYVNPPKVHAKCRWEIKIFLSKIMKIQIFIQLSTNKPNIGVSWDKVRDFEQKFVKFKLFWCKIQQGKY